MNRREFVRTAGGAAGGAAALGGAGAAAGQEGGNGTAGGGGGGQELPQPNYDGWFTGVSNYDGTTVNAMNQDTVTVEVGVDNGGSAIGFGPPAVHVSPGTTVQWEWTGDGGGHNVVSEGEGPLDSDLYSESGQHYEYTFESDGIYEYFCSPHRSSGMKGAVVVGSDYPAVEESGVVTVNPHHAGVPIQPHFVGIASGLALAASLVFSFFVLKYGESAHTSGGND